MYHPTTPHVASIPIPHCTDCANGPVNQHGLRRAHCATCGVLCYDDPANFEQGAAFCSNFCYDVRVRSLTYVA